MAYKFKARPDSDHHADGKKYTADKDGIVTVEDGEHAAILKRLGLPVHATGAAAAPAKGEGKKADPLKEKKDRLEALLTKKKGDLTKEEAAEIDALDAEIEAAEKAAKK